jgi:hypothetical protein
MAPDTRQDESYEESSDFSWTEKAFEMLQSGTLHGEVLSRHDIVSSRVWGNCPRCGHPLDDQQTHTAVTNLMSRTRGRRKAKPSEGLGEDAGVRYFDVDVSCGCEKTHDDAPAGRTGCGVSFRVELPVQVADDQR